MRCTKVYIFSDISLNLFLFQLIAESVDGYCAWLLALEPKIACSIADYYLVAGGESPVGMITSFQPVVIIYTYK